MAAAIVSSSSSGPAEVVTVATLYRRPYRKDPAIPPRFASSGSGTYRRTVGPNIAANPAAKEKIATPKANSAFQRENSLPAVEAAIPSASRLNTTPRKKENESNTPLRRRLPFGAPSTCDPTRLTTPTPAGSVQGHVLVESKPPTADISKAKSG